MAGQGTWAVAVTSNEGAPDSVTQRTEARLIVIDAPRTVELERAVHALCGDPVLDHWHTIAAPDAVWIVEVLPHPGVTDAEGDSFALALAQEGFPGVRVRTGKRHALPAATPEPVVRTLAAALCHPVVERATIDAPGAIPGAAWASAFMPAKDAPKHAERVPILGLGPDQLRALSASRLLALPVEDMLAVQSHFAELQRDPTDIELETIAQTWSEHCAHRTFRATIHHHEPGVPETAINGLLKTYIAAATNEIAAPWVLSAFEDNAGVIEFGRDWEISFKVETHNHPSAIEPFGGANTGVGGVVRDVMGVSAEPIANTDILCFGPPTLSAEDLPAGSIHPTEMVAGVVAGIGDYGNKMGIPTVNGAVLFDPGYTANPLVFCGTLGLAPRGRRPRTVVPGDLVVVIGGRAGRDGIHGATFSSEVLDADQVASLGSVVQIGDPIVEKRIADALPIARDLGLYHAITDCGAGGLSSAVGEMASETGADINLDLVPTKYPGLLPWEIWLSEAQERMVLAVPPASWKQFSEVMQAEGVEATAIGTFTGTGRLVVTSGGAPVADLDTTFLHKGAPIRTLQSAWQPPSADGNPHQLADHDATSALLSLLADPVIATKEGVVRRFDHEVQGRTVGKPFVGPLDIGPADAAVLRPVANERGGVALGNGINPRYGELDPYAMALLAIDEALRNVVAVGGDPDRTAILDNFCWGNPNLPDRLGTLVKACQGCHDAAVAFGTPFVSGKDSLFNEYRTPDGETRAIPGTLLISAMSIVPDLARAVSMPFKRAGSVLFLLGSTNDDLDGSCYWRQRGVLGTRAPRVDLPTARETFRALHRAMAELEVLACHDLSDGGLAVAAAEMALAAGLGCLLDIDLVPGAAGLPTDAVLFGESPSRFLVEVAPEHAEAFELEMERVPCERIGVVTADSRFRVGRGATVFLDCSVDDLRAAFLTPISAGMGVSA